MRASRAWTVALTGVLLGCAEPGGTFDGIRWGVSAQELPGLLGERGYRPLLAFDPAEGDQMYVGAFHGYRSLVVTRVGEQGLSKVVVGVVSSPERRPLVYHELAAWLRARHGAPVLVEGKHTPGVTEAVHGSARVREVWAVRSGAGEPGEGYVILEDRPQEGVVLSYESPGWAAELERRQAARLRDTLLGRRLPFDAVAAGSPLAATGQQR